jgi:cytochrome c biogenesis protein ResB
VNAERHHEPADCGGRPTPSPKPARRPVGGALLDLLASVKFAVAVVIIIAAVCVIGTILPQGTDAAAFVEKNPAAADRMKLFAALGLTHVFFSRWFIALLCLLALSVMVCSTRRFATLRRTTGFAQRRALGSMLTHISILLILAGGVIRGIWGQKGYLELRKGQAAAQFAMDNGYHKLPFSIALADFEIETDAPKIARAAPGVTDPQTDDSLLVQWPEHNLTARIPIELNVERAVSPQGEPATAGNTFRITVLRYIPDFTVNTQTREVSSRSSEPNNPAILVAVNGPDYHNHAWVFARFPDFTMRTEGSDKPDPLQLRYESRAAAGAAAPMGAVKNFKSTVNLIGAGAAAQTATVAVNHPLKYKGYTFYQTGYNPEDLSWTSLQVVRDPGVPVVYAGFALLIGGLFVVFYLNPWIESRRNA